MYAKVFWKTEMNKEDNEYGYEYDPIDIVAALTDYAKKGNTNEWTPNDTEIMACENAVYSLEAICDNPMNSDDYRVFYKLLAKVVSIIERS